MSVTHLSYVNYMFTTTNGLTCKHFSPPDVEDLTRKTGNFKQFPIFCSMLESAVRKVRVDGLRKIPPVHTKSLERFEQSDLRLWEHAFVRVQCFHLSKSGRYFKLYLIRRRATERSRRDFLKRLKDCLLFLAKQATELKRNMFQNRDESYCGTGVELT